MQRQVWKTQKAGAFKRLKLMNESLPDLESGKIRIRVKAIGLNFADIFAITGLYSATPSGPFIPGLEFAGEVIENKSTNASFRTGDRVIGLSRFGAYVTVIDCDPDYLVQLNADRSFAEGASFLVQTLTAWYALKRLGDLRENQLVLIQSAAGGVGLQALQICEALNAHVIGTVSSVDKLNFLKQRTDQEIIVREANFYTQLKGLLGERHLDLILDGIGGKTQFDSFRLLAPMGRLIVFGAATFTPGKNRPNYIKSIFEYLRRPTYDPLKMVNSNRSVMAFNLIWLWGQTQLLTELVREIQSIDLKAPLVGDKFSFQEMHTGLQLLRSGKSIGKIIVTVD
ncbi:MAG: zinc-binding dehydrogenase [Calditrichaeota bacterium]|nr:zinc-binding dehydrogenase [Calditrichota bacterium]